MPVSVTAVLRRTLSQMSPEPGFLLQSLFRVHAVVGVLLQVPGALTSLVQLASSVHTCAAGHTLFAAWRRSSRAHDHPLVSW